jgi:hypothetical protein
MISLPCGRGRFTRDYQQLQQHGELCLDVREAFPFVSADGIQYLIEVLQAIRRIWRLPQCSSVPTSELSEAPITAGSTLSGLESTVRRASPPLVFSAMNPVVDGACNVRNQPRGNYNFRQVRRTHTHSLEQQSSHERTWNERSIGGAWLDLSDCPFGQWFRFSESVRPHKSRPLRRGVAARAFSRFAGHWPP